VKIYSSPLYEIFVISPSTISTTFTSFNLAIIALPPILYFRTQLRPLFVNVFRTNPILFYFAVREEVALAFPYRNKHVYLVLAVRLAVIACALYHEILTAIPL